MVKLNKIETLTQEESDSLRRTPLEFAADILVDLKRWRGENITPAELKEAERARKRDYHFPGYMPYCSA